MKNIFSSIQNLNFDINQEISMEKLFKGCSTITSINLSSLKVGYVTDSKKKENCYGRK